jgi:hypothetical protein
MKINTRETCGYLDVNIEFESIKIDLGFHDAKQAENLLSTIKIACQDLEEYIERKEGA